MIFMGPSASSSAGLLQYSHEKGQKGGSLSFKFNLVDPEGNKLIDQSFFISVLGRAPSVPRASRRSHQARFFFFFFAQQRMQLHLFYFFVLRCSLLCCRAVASCSAQVHHQLSKHYNLALLLITCEYVTSFLLLKRGNIVSIVAVKHGVSFR